MMADELKIEEVGDFRVCKSKNYNFLFNKKTGFFARWGKTRDDDPDYSPFGCELLDLEISVNGCLNKCRECYKNNTDASPTNMSFETFKNIVDKVAKNKILSQIAFGITGVKTNPEFIKMMEYSRSIGVIPNFTLTGIDLDDEMAQKCAKLVGAVAISVNKNDKNVCYDTIKKFTDLGLTQVNMHCVASEESLSFVYEVLDDIMHDERLKKLNCIVFLGIKPKGRAKGKFHSLDVKNFKKLIKFCFDFNMRFGMDSCSCSKYEIAINDMEGLTEDQKKQFIQMGESCESFGLFSSYINVAGSYFPCSFSEGEEGWEEGIDVLNCEDFVKDVWFSEKLNKWREKSISTRYPSGCRKCLIFPEINPE